MLINFRTQNFRSLRDLNELSLIVPTGADSRQDVVMPLPRQPNTRVGSVAGVFGPNASGKSNVLEAIQAMRRAVLDSHQSWKPEGGAPQDPFLLDEEHGREPTLFEVDLLLDDRRFQYGFCLDKDGIASEWLYEYPQNRRRTLYERNRGQEPEFRFGKSLTGHISTLRELTRPNSLFLSVAAANNHRQLGRIYRWFSRCLEVITPEETTLRVRQATRALSDKSLSPRIVELLRLADLGIIDARVTKIDASEEFESWLRDMFERMPGVSDQGLPSNFDEIFELARKSVEFDHEADEGARKVPISVERESRGTLNWFSLVGALVSALQAGTVLLIDELDASLHPYLSVEVIRMFHDPDLNRAGAQLIFTSHDPTLLGNLIGRPALRRDEIWITEKDRSGATHLYALTDFKPRKLENLERGYLQGRYGGVPFVDHERARESVG